MSEYKIDSNTNQTNHKLLFGFMTHINNYKYYYITIFASFLYALYIVVNKKFLHTDTNPLLFALGSSLSGSIFSFIFLVFSKRVKEIKVRQHDLWKYIVLYGILSGILARIALFFGQSLISATNTGFLIGGSRPIFSFIFAYIFMRETLRGSQILTILLMILGVFLLSSDGNLTIPIGDWILILCGMILGSSHALSRKITKAGMHPLVLTFFELLISAIGLALVAAITVGISFTGWTGWLLSGFVFSVSVVMRNLALSHMKAPIFSSLVLTSPVFSALMGLLFLNENLNISQIWGSVIILIGGYFLIWVVGKSDLRPKTLS